MVGGLGCLGPPLKVYVGSPQHQGHLPHRCTAMCLAAWMEEGFAACSSQAVMSRWLDGSGSWNSIYMCILGEVPALLLGV